MKLGLVLSLFFTALISLMDFGQQKLTNTVSPASAYATDARPNDYFINLGSAVRISCDNRRGTAFVIDKNTFLTANHVVGSSQACKLDSGAILTIAYTSVDLDIATIHGDTGNIPRMGLNCDGYITGQTYLMVGFADGVDFVINRGAPTTAYYSGKELGTGKPLTHLRILDGRAYHGMSGGPIIDMSSGQVVGIVSAVPISKETEKLKTYSREIRDTYVCSKG